MRDAYIDCLDPRALQWKMFTDFVEKENYNTGIIFIDVLILISSREREREREQNVVNKTLSPNVI